MTDYRQRCEALEAEIERLREAFTTDLQNAQMDVLAKNRQIGKLKADLAQVRDDAPESVEIKGLLAFARDTLGKSSRWYIGSDGDRAKLARATVKRYGIERAKQTVIALASKPYAGPRGRAAEAYPGATKYNELEHCWGTDKRFTEMEAIYAALTTPTLEDPPQPEPPKLEAVDEIVEVDGARLNYTTFDRARTRRHDWANAPIDTVLGALTDRGCEWRPGQADRWMAQCPAHEDRSPSLSIQRNADGRVLVHCFAGCEGDDVIGALGLEWRDLSDRSEYDDQRANVIVDTRGGGPVRRGELADTLRMIDGALRSWGREAA